MAYDKVCEWLGAETVPVNVKFKRTNEKKLNEVIENWSEVRDILAPTKYAWMLEMSHR